MYIQHEHHGERNYSHVYKPWKWSIFLTSLQPNVDPQHLIPPHNNAATSNYLLPKVHTP